MTVQDETTFAATLSRIEPHLRRAFVALYGPERGREATLLALNLLYEGATDPGGRDDGDLVAALFSLVQGESQKLAARPLYDRQADKLADMSPELATMLSLLSRDERVAGLLVGAAGWSTEEVGDLLGVTKERAGALSDRALRRLLFAAGGRGRPSTDDEGEKTAEPAERGGPESDKEALIDVLYRFLALAEPVSLDEAVRGPVVDTVATVRPLSSTWRRLVIGALVLLLVLVGGLVIGLGATRSTTVTSYTTPGREPGAGLLSDSVIVVPNLPGTTKTTARHLPTVAEIDAETGKRLHSPVPRDVAAATNPITTGRWIIDVLFRSVTNASSLGRAVAFATGSRHTTDLGPASDVYPGLRPGTVWILLHHATMAGNYSPTCSLRLVTVGGQVLVSPAYVPCPWQVLYAVRGGLVIVGGTGTTEMWDPYTGLTSPLTGFDAPIVAASSSTVVAPNWQRFCSTRCTILLANPISGVIRRVIVQPPSGTSLTTSAAVSPNGDFLAITGIPIGVATSMENAPVVGPNCCDSGNRSIKGRLVVIRIPTGLIVRTSTTTTIASGSTSTTLVAPTTTTVALSRPASFLEPSLVEWAPDGSYVFLSGSTTDVAAVPVWSDVAPVVTIALDLPPGRPPYPGDRFLIASR